LSAPPPTVSAPETSIPGTPASYEPLPLTADGDAQAGSTPSDTGADTRLYTIRFDGAGPFEVRIDIPLEEYQELYFDGELWIPGADYDARSGSTILTISEARLAKVADGSHAIRAVFSDQTVEIPFTLNRPASASSDNPQTVSGSAKLVAANAAQTGSARKTLAPIILAAAAAVLAVGTAIIRRARVHAVKR
jgi:hypothetical protein